MPNAIIHHLGENQPKVHELAGYIEHIYLVEYADKLLLLDGACKPDTNTILRYIKNTLGRSASDLKLVIISHFHPDHAGAAKALQRATGCRIATRTMTSKHKKRHWYGGMSGRMAFIVDIYLTKWIAGKMKKPKRSLWFNPILVPDIALDGSQSLPNFTDWQVVFTEGHTDRDISLLHTPSRSVYVADLFVKTKRGFVCPFPIHSPNHYRNSLERIWSLAPMKYMLAHGGVVSLSGADKESLRAQVPNMPQTIKHKLLRQLKTAKLLRHKN